ncbi:hypothetical protein [Methyloceanibacter sp.]|jgi:hypothetical protein|uniref:hypothetical protein n=1 Tax=Methyloceanibacter sp. TaxID=1965321 RepID=UPI00351BD930
MTLSLRKATLALALVGGSALAVATPGIANAGAPDGYFSNSYRYFGPALPPPAYAEIVPIYPAPIYPAPAPAYAVPAPVYQAPVYPPAYDPSAAIGFENGYGYAPDPELDYIEPDGTLDVGVE